MSILMHNLVHIIGNSPNTQNMPIVELSDDIYPGYTWIKQHVSKPQYRTFLAYYQ